jgi:hypothetical protein
MDKENLPLVVHLKIELTIENKMMYEDYLKLQSLFTLGENIDNKTLIESLNLDKRPLCVTSFKQKPEEINNNIFNAEITIVS